MKGFLTIILCVLIEFSFSQQGIISGFITDAKTNETLPFVNVRIDGTSIGTTTDIDGKYTLGQLKPGYYNIVASFVGYTTQTFTEVKVTNAKPTTLDIQLQPSEQSLEEVEVIANPFTINEESPTSVKNISSTEVMRNPGGNRDISKVLQSFPGVGATVSFRNDILVRGGAPSENSFYIDGIEIPNINHFATQGSSGGPVGLINVNFINDVKFYSSAFPVNKSDAISSVMDFRFKEGNPEKLIGTFTLGSSDVGLTLDGPIGKKSTFIFSARRSYLQFLFKALALPFLPTYNDFQYKQTIKFNKKTKLTLLGIGAIDDFKLNTKVNNGLEDSSLIERNNYILQNLPVNTQWNYSVGAKLTRYHKNGTTNIILSRSMLNNNSYKYRNNVEVESGKILDYQSQEAKNKFRLERKGSNSWFNYTVGFGSGLVLYTNNTNQQISIGDSVFNLKYNTRLRTFNHSVFGQINQSYFDEKLTLSLGLRSDFSNYSKNTNNPLLQISPRFAFSYKLAPKLRFNGNTGIFYQLPAYTAMGYKDNSGELVNKSNGLTYIQSTHFVSGFSYSPSPYLFACIEGFYKKYNNYPFLLTDSISLANLGSDFGVIGNAPVSSTSKGRAYGFEVFVQRKMKKDFFGNFSYTFVISEFTDKHGKYVPSAWDVRNILNITIGKQFKNNWQIGAKFRYSGGSPYTPYDTSISPMVQVWDVNQKGVLNYNKLNSLRLGSNNGLDIRIDKKWYFKKQSLNVYIDIQNIYNFKANLQPYFTVDRDSSGNPIVDPNNPNKYKWHYIPNQSGTVLPSVGILYEF